MLPVLALFPLVAFAQTEEGAGNSTVTATAEYGSFCRTCPYNICAHTAAPAEGDTYEVNCWAIGDNVGETDVWLGTTNNCYVPYYDVQEIEGDLTETLPSCGEIPLQVTQEAATVRFLSECKWGTNNDNETIQYYGRDQELTLTCWSEGSSIVGYPYWFRTLDYCWVAGTALWWEPDRENLEWCGPDFGPRANESEPLDTSGAKPTPLPPDESEDESEPEAEPAPEPEPESGDSVVRRWLQEGEVGEASANCYSCPNSNSTDCAVTRVYEPASRVISQCVILAEEVAWLYTVNWCYVVATDLVDPPSEDDAYPSCENWTNWEELVDEQPVDEELVDEEPVDEEPVDEEPVDEEPVDEEPVDEESVDEEPVDEEPVDEEPVDEELVDEK